MVTPEAVLGHHLELEIDQFIHNECQQDNRNDQLQVTMARYRRENVAGREFQFLRVRCARSGERCAALPDSSKKRHKRQHHHKRTGQDEVARAHDFDR